MKDKGGANSEQPFVVSETDGTWGNAQPVTGAAISTVRSPYLENVSCGAPGDCTAIGTYEVTGYQSQVFLVTEVAGVWGTASAIDESALGTGLRVTIGSVSCPAAGECAAAGTYR